MNSFGQVEKLEGVLERLGAKLAAWQVKALFLGAQTSTNVRLGPQHLLGHLFGDEPVLGDGLEDANANLRVLMDTWNSLVADHGRGQVRVSTVRLTDPPTTSELVMLTERRSEELKWFIRGIDAGGDDPIEFGSEGQDILKRLAEAGAFCDAYRELLLKKSDHSDKELVDSGVALGRLSETVEQMIGDLMTISNGVRRRAIAEYNAMEGRETDDGVPVRRAVKIGRNAPCPCGRGLKWKRCCGAPERTQ